MLHDLMQTAAPLWRVRAIDLSDQNALGHTQVGFVKIYGNLSMREVSDQIEAADVLISHLSAAPKASSLAKKHGKPLIQVIHNDLELSTAMVAAGGHFIYNSRWIAERFKGAEGVIVRPPALFPSKKMANPDGAITQVNLCAKKGPEIFYKMAQHLPKRQFLGVLGGYNTTRQVLRGGLNIQFHEHTPDIDSFYRKTAILVIPSHYESYGRVGVEAMQRGIPVIGADTPGLKESIGDGGIIAPRNQIVPWVKSAKQILNDYDFYSGKAVARYEILREQTSKDLQNFLLMLEGLC